MNPNTELRDLKRDLRWKVAYLLWLMLTAVGLIALALTPSSPHGQEAAQAVVIFFAFLKLDQWLARRAGTKPLL